MTAFAYITIWFEITAVFENMHALFKCEFIIGKRFWIWENCLNIIAYENLAGMDREKHQLICNIFSNSCILYVGTLTSREMKPLMNLPSQDFVKKNQMHNNNLQQSTEVVTLKEHGN